MTVGERWCDAAARRRNGRLCRTVGCNGAAAWNSDFCLRCEEEIRALTALAAEEDEGALRAHLRKEAADLAADLAAQERSARLRAALGDLPYVLAILGMMMAFWWETREFWAECLQLWFGIGG